MNENSKYLIWGLVLFAAYKIFNTGKAVVTGTIDYVQETIADTGIGEVVGLRTVTGSQAAKWIKNCLWLRKDYREWLLLHYPVNQYRFDLLGAYEADDIAKQIIKSNYVIFDNGTIDRLIQYGLATAGVEVDDPAQAERAISRIKNQAQALQVTDFYYLKTGKNLSAGLQWLPDEFMIKVYEHLVDLPTGVSPIGGTQLGSLPKPKIYGTGV